LAWTCGQVFFGSVSLYVTLCAHLLTIRSVGNVIVGSNNGPLRTIFRSSRANPFKTLGGEA